MVDATMTANVSYLVLVVINFTRAQKWEKTHWVDLQEEDVESSTPRRLDHKQSPAQDRRPWSRRYKTREEACDM